MEIVEYMETSDRGTLYKKYKSGEITRSEYQKQMAKNKGYKNTYEQQKDSLKKQGYDSHHDYVLEKVKGRGFKNYTDYLNWLSEKRGYNDRNEYNRERYYTSGKGLPMDKNTTCSIYLGIYVAENIVADYILHRLYKEAIKMPNNNKDYDWLCEKLVKVDVKSCSVNHKNEFSFFINENKIADKFMCIGFNNRKDFDIEHVWFIKGDEIIRGRKLNVFPRLSINDGSVPIERMKSYELLEMLNDIKLYWNNYKKENNIIVGEEENCMKK